MEDKEARDIANALKEISQKMDTLIQAVVFLSDINGHLERISNELKGIRTKP